LSYIILVDLSSIIDSLRVCTVHIGSPQDKGSAEHYSKHTQGATSAFSNCRHNKHLNLS